MIVTEEEARDMTCKEKEKIQVVCLSLNAGTYDSTGCDGSACMSWRWWDGEKGQPRFMLNAAGNDWIFLHYDPRRGYCGLSGTPMEE